MAFFREHSPELLGQDGQDPLSRHTPNPELTPRSKIKALLATIDDDSDASPVRQRPLLASNWVADLPGDERVVPQESTGFEPDSSDSDALPSTTRHTVLPRERANEAAQDDSPNQLADSRVSAYERVKRDLLSKAVSEDSPRDQSPPKRDGIDVESKLVRRSLHHKKQLSTTTPPAGPPSTSRRQSSDGGSVAEDSSRSVDESGNEAQPASPRELLADARPESSADANGYAELGSGRKDRFWALVQKKKQEREAREAEEEAKASARHERSENRGLDSSLRSVSDIDSSDSGAEKNLTQASRPARKASKKALEEMSRETQRISRNMQLTHEATTMKKITKESLMSRFNFRGNKAKPADVHVASSTAASSIPCSDAEEPVAHVSPTTSPGLLDGPGDAYPGLAKPTAYVDLTAKGKSREQNQAIFAEETRPRKLDKGKGKAIGPRLQDAPAPKPVFTQRPIKLRPPPRPTLPEDVTMDTDSDLEVELPSKIKSRALEVLSRVPEKRSSQDRSRTALRALAHLTSPGRKKTRTSGGMTQGDLEASLRTKARQQAAHERAERLQDLKARGIVIQSVEEREKEQTEVENLLEKARQEEMELSKKERDAAKKERRENGEDDPLLSSDDENYQEDDAEGDIDISGSEEADDEEDEVDGEEDPPADNEDRGPDLKDIEANAATSLIENEALESDAGGSESHDDFDEAGDAHDDDAPCFGKHRRPRRAVVEDDEDEEALPAEAPPPISASAPFNPFGALSANPTSAAMGLTQAFAATMSDSQQPNEQDSLADLPPMVMPDPPTPGPDLLVADSQPSAAPAGAPPSQDDDTQMTALTLSQSQIVQDSLNERAQGAIVQPSQMPDPTQDQGFEHLSPVKDRFAPPAPPSTADTVLLSTDSRNLPAVKKGRLHRRVRQMSFSDPDDDGVIAARESKPKMAATDAFDVMRKAAEIPQLRADDFDKKESKAKQMVEEQAEESEDEYAGLGGASDDNSDSEDDGEVRNMIDVGDVEVDERKLAAFHANKDRMDDEKAVQKLYRDINTGGLRRKRGADLDLSDSDDAAEARQRRKRRQFAQMQKALLENEAVKKIAEDPKKLAFFRAIEDRDGDDDDNDGVLNLLSETPNGTQDQESTQEIPESQVENHGASMDQAMPPPPGMRPKRPLEESYPDLGNRRAPAAARRTNPTRKPPALADMQDSLSFLTEHPAEADLAASPAEPSSEPSGDENAEHGWTNRRRRPAAEAIVDRLSLKRQDSAASMGSAGSTGTRMAFQNPSAGRESAGFRVPSLLRRATSSFSNADEYGISHGAGAEGGRSTDRGSGSGVRMGGTKKSGVGYLVKREREKKIEVGREQRLLGSAGRVGKRGKKGSKQGGFIAGLLGSGQWD